MSGPSTYEPKTGIEKWLDTRLPIIRFGADLMDFPTPKNLNYWWTFGGILAVCLVIQIVTGIVLAMHYVANTQMAFASVERIMRDVDFGWLIRNIHAKQGLNVFIDLHNPGADDPIFFFGPFAFERMAGIQQRNSQRWIDLAAANITEPMPVQPKYRFATYVTTDEERGRMSSGWVRANTGDSTISVTLETGWNSPLMSVEGYGNVGAGLGRALAAYVGENPRRE